MKLATLVLAVALMVTPAFAQHGHSGPAGHGPQGHAPAGHVQEHGQSRGVRHDHVNDRDMEHFGRENSFRYDRDHARFVRGRGWGYTWGGYWFWYARPWPVWFNSCSVYFDLGPDGLWYAHCYDNPGLFIQVYPY